MKHTRQTCVIALGLTIMDRCPECDKIERAAEETKRIDRELAFHEQSKRKPTPPPLVSHDGGKTWNPVESPREDAPQQPVQADGKVFFVGCREDEGERRRALLLGPYDTHKEALASVERGRKMAVDNDPNAYWYSFGTCSIKGPTDRNGVFGK